MKKIIVDIECISNCFIANCLNIDTRKKITLEISERRNDIAMFPTIFNHDDRVFITFNGIDYDGVLINYIVLNQKLGWKEMTSELKKMSDKIIVEKVFLHKWRNAKLFRQIDLLRMLYSKELRVGLKEIQVSMFYPNVLEMEIDWDQPIEVNKIDELIHYCWNDVDSTEWVYLRCLNDLVLRQNIEEEFGLDCYSQDGMTLGVNILAKEYCEAAGVTPEELKNYGTSRGEMPLVDIILSWISYDTPELIEFLEMLKTRTIVNTKGDLKYEVTLDGMTYGIGTGGIHSRNKPMVYTTNDEYDLEDGDVDSLYPSTIINYKFIPEHLGLTFLEVYKDIRDRRLEAKRRKKEAKKFSTLNDTFKLSLNGAIGNFIQPYSWLYDPLANMKVTVNNQLLILKWIEMLYLAGFKTISANTDGITVYVKKSMKDKYYEVCKKWCELTGYTLEFTPYEKLVMFAVNDYVAVKKTDSTKFDDKYKFKGATFLQEARMGKGMKLPLVIPKALFEHFVMETDYAEYINNYSDIKHFTRFEKTGKQFKVKWGDTWTQRINRFYVSKDGNYLHKVNDANPEKIKTISILKDTKVSLLNKFDDREFEEYNVDKQYYIDASKEIIDQFQVFDLNVLK